MAPKPKRTVVVDAIKYYDDWTRENDEDTNDTKQVGKKDETEAKTFVPVDRYHIHRGKVGTASTIVTRNDITTPRVMREFWFVLEAAGLSERPYRAGIVASEEERLALLTAELRENYPRWSHSAAFALLDCAKQAGVNPPHDLQIAYDGKKGPFHYWLCVVPAYDEPGQFKLFMDQVHLRFGGKENWDENVENFMWECYRETFTQLGIPVPVVGSAGQSGMLKLRPDALTEDAKKELYLAFQAAGVDGIPHRTVLDDSTEEGRAFQSYVQKNLQELQAQMEESYSKWSPAAARFLLACATEADCTPPDALVQLWDPKNKRKPRYFQTCGPFFNNQKHFETFMALIYKKYEGGKEAWENEVEKLIWYCYSIVDGGKNSHKGSQRKERSKKKIEAQAQLIASLTGGNKSQAADDGASASGTESTLHDTGGSPAASADSNLAEMLKNKKIIDEAFKDDEQEGTKEVTPSPLNRKGETADDAIELCDESDSEDPKDNSTLPFEAPSERRETRAAALKRKLFKKGKRKPPSEKAEPAKVKKEYAGKMASTYLQGCERDRRAFNVEYYEILLKQDEKDTENSK